MLADAWEEIREPGIGTNGLGNQGCDSGKLAGMEREYKQGVYRTWLHNKMRNGGLKTTVAEKEKMDPGRLRQERHEKKEHRDQLTDTKLTKAESRVRNMKKQHKTWIDEARQRDEQWIESNKEFYDLKRIQRECWFEEREVQRSMRQEVINKERQTLKQMVEQSRIEQRAQQENKRAKLVRTLPSPTRGGDGGLGSTLGGTVSSNGAPKRLHPIDKEKHKAVQKIKAAKEANKKLLASLHGDTEKRNRDIIRAERERRKDDAERQKEMREVSTIKNRERLKANFYHMSKGILEDRLREDEMRHEIYLLRKAMSPTYRYYYYE